MYDNERKDTRPVQMACFVANEALHRRLHDTATKVDATCERFDSETALMRACRYRNFDLIIVGPGTGMAEERVLLWLSCRSERATPVIFLSPGGNAAYTARALEAGADDVLTENVDPVELVARIRSVLRRHDHRFAHRRRIDTMGFTFDRETSRCLDRGEPVNLTPREFAMAWLLFSTPGRYLTRWTISAALWGASDKITSRTIEQHVYKLRKKLRLGPDRGVTICTGYTQGYRLEICGDEDAAAQPPPVPLIRERSGTALHDATAS